MNEKIRICAMSDMHGNIPDADVKDHNIVVIAGDSLPLNGFGKWDIYKQKKWLETKLFSWMKSYPNTQFVVIPGNHDLVFDQSKTFSFKDLDWKISFPANCHFLLDSSIQLFGLNIYGTPWVPIISYRWAFECEHDKLVEKFNRIPNNLDILISHAPPRIPGSDIDYSMQTQVGPFGSSELAQAIFMKQPKHVFCGHIHSGDHECIEFEGTKIFNVSVLDEDYSIAYKPLNLSI